MISSIKMCSCATFNSEGASIKDCKKVNFIYGPNGSGKSTISNFLQCPSDSLYINSEITWSNEARPEMMVYNRRFREQNFGSSDIAGVFTLGQATIEEINEIKQLKKKKTELETEYYHTVEALEKQKTLEKKHQDDFRDTVWNVILKEHENEFQDAFKGLRSNKERFKDEVIRRFQIKHPSSYSIEELQSRAQTLFSTRPETGPLLNIEVKNVLSEIAEIETASVWSKAIVGNEDIELGKLIKHLDNADWVNNGRSYITDNVCPFCQQPTISSEFVEQLSLFFDKEYDTALSQIDAFIQKYDIASIMVISLFKSILDNSYSISLSKMDVETYSNKLQLYEAQLRENLSAFRQKKTEPSRKLQIKGTQQTATLLTQAIEAANKEIDKHNHLVANLNSEKEKLINDVWDYLLDEQEALICGYMSDINKFTKAKNGISSKMNSLKANINRLDADIIQAETKITSVQPTVDEINRLLKSYGFQNFQIVPSPSKANHYQIQRPDGTLASNTLSEGEETFISFLYFVQLAKGATDITKVSSKKILVLDDPICSLDSTILYIVSAIVKKLIAEVKAGTSDVEQIFILTHNVFFHKEAAFVDGRTREEANVNYWIIHKEDSTSKIIAYGQKNPITTSYELLWNELRDSSTSLVTTQNTMRRIIENYFGMLGNKKIDYISDSFDTAEEKMICESLLYWINDGSHSIPDDLFISSYSDMIPKYKKVFRQVFVESGHEAHYNMMMGIETE